MATSAPPAGTSLLAHVKRAFGWNLGNVVPSQREAAALAAAGVTALPVQRYAAWRRSLLLVALVPALLVALLSLWDAYQQGLDELAFLGAVLRLGWLAAAASLPVACWLGIRRWTKPGAGVRILLGAWLVAFLIPFVTALAPVEAIYRVQEAEADQAAELPGGGNDADDLHEGEKVAYLSHFALDMVLSASAFFLLLPAVISLLPGAMNGCLRIKAMFPAAHLPGWLLVTVAPVFLLFWLALLVLINPGTQSLLLVAGILLWSGGPLVYSLRARAFVEPLLSAGETARIARAKRTAGLVSLTGIALIASYVLTTTVAELHILGTDPDLALSRKLADFGDDHTLGFAEAVQAYADSDALVYAFDAKFPRMLLDTLAKLLLVTAVFAHLILRATLAQWKNEQALRGRPEAAEYDAGAAAATAALAPSGPGA